MGSVTPAFREAVAAPRHGSDRGEGRLCVTRAGDASEKHRERENISARADTLECVDREPSGRNDGAGEGGGFSCSSNSFNAHYAEAAPQKLIPLTQSFKVASLSQNPTTQLLDRHRLNMEHGTVRDPNLSHSLTIGFNTSWWQNHLAAKTERASLDRSAGPTNSDGW